MDKQKIGDNELARRLRDRGSPVSQPTITRIATGKTKNPDESVLKAIAQYFNVTTAYLRGEKAAKAVAELQTKYADLSRDAIEVARMWMRLPDFKRRGYLQAIMTDAAVLEVFPELERAMRAAAVATDPDYHRMTDSFGRARVQLEKQLKLAGID